MSKLPFLSPILKALNIIPTDQQSQVDLLLKRARKLDRNLKHLPKDTGISVLRSFAETLPGRTLPANILAQMAHSQLA